MDTQTLLYNFTAFFIIIDPVGTAAIFAVMTHGQTNHQRRSMALRATLLASVILFVFAFIGEPLLTALGIGLPAFRVAGGVLLFLLAVDMVFARQSGLRSVTDTEDREAVRREDITVFPLAFPLIAGPGAMTSVVLLMGEAAGRPLPTAGVLGVLGAVLLLLLILLLVATRVLRVLGQTGANVISRLLGVLLAALAVQFIFDGLAEALRL
ncbi:MarC family protein [Telmatospirillum sp. J64-1]|uniref:MarC family protein n=1 Tax=Telmatospirillum sp. J64-1 TaxID=2502183 RepID=UPI00115C4DC8|nr:MarC family protein [Telmatospirillum sp. J64-1]